MDGSTLNALAYENMVSAFEAHNHRPSKSMLEGLRRILETSTEMLLGKAGSKYYLSSLDPGVGKSTAIIKWVHAYLRCRETYGNHGILICFDRLAEITRFVDECNFPSDCFSVKVSESHDGRELNDRGLGSGNTNNALVLLTTKQQIILRSKGSNFKETTALHYQGKARTVRIWDESLIVGKELSLDRFDLLGLVKEMSKVDPEIALKIDDIAGQIKSCKNGEVLLIPNMGLSPRDIMQLSSRLRKDDVAETLSLFLGRLVTVRSDDRGHVAVDCGASVPEDFAPCLVTDASGRVRETYKLQQHYRGDLERLQPEATKDYSNLCIYVWRKGSGKSSYQKNGYKVYSEEVINVINSLPDEEFLVVRHLEHEELRSEVMNHVTAPDRVKFIHWGIHTATNDYDNIPNVIITSPFTFRLADYEALARASGTLMTTDGVISDEQQKYFRYGEHAHHFLQAICRGIVRKSDGAGCHKSRVWIITPTMTKIEENIDVIFPNCQVERWKTSPGALKGLQQKSYEYIMNKLSLGFTSIVSTEVRDHVGMTSSNFRRDVIENVSLLDKLSLNEVTIEHRNNRYYFTDNSVLDAILSNLVNKICESTDNK